VRAVLRRPDVHFHRDLLVDPVGCFQGREWHGDKGNDGHGPSLNRGERERFASKTA
jgi:hypothetical protein